VLPFMGALSLIEPAWYCIGWAHLRYTPLIDWLGFPNSWGPHDTVNISLG
jgi:hypothetical protein